MTLSVTCALLAGCGSDGADSAESSGSATASSASAKPATVPTVLILDASGSMTADDAPRLRIDAAKQAALGLVDSLPDEAMLGLVTYGTRTGSSDAEMAAGCQDVTKLIEFGRLARERVRGEVLALRPSGYTPISLALQQAVSMLPTDGGKQAVVLVSDGEDTCGSPPCEVAKQLRAQHPGLSISTVGFKTDGAAREQLNCVATATDGLFVQAANSKQLAARLMATQDTETARESLSPNGIAGVEVRSAVGDIKRSHSEFPDVGSSGRVVVVWRECELTFVDGVLDSIAPHGGGRTIDGIAPGTPVAKATELYGDPLETVDNRNGTYSLTYTADEARGNAYRMAVTDFSATAGTISGLIKTIVLCHCLPKKPTAWVATTDSYGPFRLGMSLPDAAGALAPISVTRNHYYNCSVLGENRQYALTLWIKDDKGVVTGINTPAGTVTDRGVGDGSTVDQIRAVYARDHDVDVGNSAGQGSPGVVVKPTGSAKPGDYLVFPIENNGTVGPPSVGRGPANEGC
ncbi:vWA domain-containing protein [Antrihabitans stalactiti]|nr:VWA domain-containing protein [Antrihabitans stalactiti]